MDRPDDLTNVAKSGDATIVGLSPGSAVRCAMRRRCSPASPLARASCSCSPGKPQDEDGYEGRYGIEDVRQAVAEARLQGVRVFCVTIDREGPDYLPRLFGPHAYTVIWNAETLPERLPALYRRLTGQS